MAGSKQREKKKKRQEEVAEKKRALSSPESLQIHYQDIRKGGAVETKGLSEFLLWAKQEKVAVFTKEYYDYAFFNKPPAVEEKAKFWCPALETACMIPQNTAEEFYEFRNGMYVDTFTQKRYADAVVQVIAREKAFRMHRSLMSEESQPPVESQSELAEPEAKEEELVGPEASASHSDFLEAEIHALIMQLITKVDETNRKVDETNRKVDETKEELSEKLDNLKQELKEDLTQELKQELTQDLKQELKGVLDEIKAARKAISDNGESIVRLTLGIFLGKLGEKTNKEISIPVYGKKLPYVPFSPLEQLASLCLTSAKKPRSTPLEAEIDILVKVSDKAASNRLHSPPSSQQQVLSTSYGFTTLIIGENTRSKFLCNDVYIHPSEAESSTSSKLLYKFVQIERGLRACMDYYNVGQECLEGAYIVSPSFKNISSSDQLIDAVLAGRSVAFCNIDYLHANHKMWLVSM